MDLGLIFAFIICSLGKFVGEESALWNKFLDKTA